MANKRIQKKKFKQSGNFNGIQMRRVEVSRPTAVNIAVRSIVNSEIFGYASKDTGYTSKEKGHLKQVQSMEIGRAANLISQLDLTDEEIKAHINARQLKASKLTKELKTLMEYQKGLQKQGKTIPRDLAKMYGEYGLELAMTKGEIKQLENIREIGRKLGTFAEAEYDMIDGVDNATYWSAIKRYEELLNMGMVPALDGLDKYESAMWALDHLPYDEVRQIIVMADEKSAMLRQKYQDYQQKELDYFTNAWNTASAKYLK